MSKSGQSSVTSIPTIPVEAACFRRYISSMADKPPALGTDTPGANAGSRQSKSIEIYLLSAEVEDIFLAIFEIPASAISRGVIISSPALLIFSSSSASASPCSYEKAILKI